MTRPRRNRSAKFKAIVALGGDPRREHAGRVGRAVQGPPELDRSVAARVAGVRRRGIRRRDDEARAGPDANTLHARIRRVALDHDLFWPVRPVVAAMPARSADRSDPRTALGAAGAAAGLVALVAALPAASTSDADLPPLRVIDALHLEHPFAGSRMLRDRPGREGFAVGHEEAAPAFPTTCPGETVGEDAASPGPDGPPKIIRYLTGAFVTTRQPARSRPRLASSVACPVTSTTLRFSVTPGRRANPAVCSLHQT